MSSPTSGSTASAHANRAGDETTPVAFGKYRLLHRIARGGMGEVYRASLVGELGFEKPLVIKTILPELASQPRFVDMFAAEAKTAVALSHGNIVPIYELGRAEDTLYIVMGYVDGPSVEQLLATHRRRNHPPPLAVALSIARGVLSGLAYAHTEEPGRPAVVHRDITPRNIMVDRSGQVRIVDFGIALPARAAAGSRAGSTGYVAPEQARAEAVDPRADVFSTACLLYELLTLQRAFPHEGVWTAPDLTELPEAMRRPLVRALSLDPAERPADASAFLTALGEAITRHAATFSEADLAAHLRMLYPDGRWVPTPVSEAADGEVTPTTAVRPTTMTFATRLTAVTAAAAGDDESGGDDAEAEAESGRSVHGRTDGSRSAIDLALAATSTAGRRRAWWVGLGVAAAGVVGLWLASSDPAARDREAKADTVDASASGPSVEPLASASADDHGPTDTRPPAPESSDPNESSDPESSDPESSTDPTTTTEPAPPPTLVLHVEPAQATVRIGTQRFAGRSPFTLPLPTHGVLEATVEHPGHQPQTVELRAGEPGERTLALRPVPQGRGSLQVLAPSVSWAEVTVDGRRFGVTPTRTLELTAGAHRVTVRCVPDVCPESRVLLRRTVDIEPGETLRLSVP